jgi:hypothetical protein
VVIVSMSSVGVVDIAGDGFDVGYERGKLLWGGGIDEGELVSMEGEAVEGERGDGVRAGWVVRR